MLLEHTLQMTVKFHSGIKFAEAFAALFPLAHERGWTESQILNDEAPMDDVVVAKIIDGSIKSISIFTQGVIGADFEDLVRETARRLGPIAQPGFIDLRFAARGVVDANPTMIWFGPADQVERVRKAHAIRRIVPMLLASGVGAVSHSVLNAMADSISGQPTTHDEGTALNSMSDLVLLTFVCALVFGAERVVLRNLKDQGGRRTGEPVPFGQTAQALKLANAAFALEIPHMPGASYCFDMNGAYVGALRQSPAVDAFTPTQEE